MASSVTPACLISHPSEELSVDDASPTGWTSSNSHRRPYASVSACSHVKLTGACDSCSISWLTLKGGVERILKDRVPGVTSVEAV